MIIGITGPSGSGKTVLSEYFLSKGIPAIDADKLYHSMLIPPSPCLDAIRSAFGNSIFDPDGSLNRGVLSNIVFNDPEKLQLLNDTVLRIVIARIRELIDGYISDGNRCVVVDAPTLIESGFNKDCDVVLTVISPKEQRIPRIAERDGISQKKALERVRAQKDDDFYIRESDHVIYNDSSEEAFRKKIEELFASLGIV